MTQINFYTKEIEEIKNEMEKLIPKLNNLVFSMKNELVSKLRDYILNNLSNVNINPLIINFFADCCEQIDDDFIKIVSNALFEKPTMENSHYPIIQNDIVRNALMRLLNKLMVQQNNVPLLINECVQRLLKIKMITKSPKFNKGI